MKTLEKLGKTEKKYEASERSERKWVLRRIGTEDQKMTVSERNILKNPRFR